MSRGGAAGPVASRTRVAPLTVEEWSELVRTITRSGNATPRDLLDGDPVSLGLDASIAERVTLLLRGLGSVGIEIERLRLTPSPLHSDDRMAELVDALVKVWERLALKQAA